jgi:hypothetical protein
MDYHLKAATEQAFWTALISAGVVEEVDEQQLKNSEGNAEPELVTVTVKRVKPGQTLDLIGKIWKPTGETITVKSVNDTDMEVPEMAPIDGYHANLRGGLSEEQIATLGDIVIEAPATPYRVWA